MADGGGPAEAGPCGRGSVGELAERMGRLEELVAALEERLGVEDAERTDGGRALVSAPTDEDAATGRGRETAPTGDEGEVGRRAADGGRALVSAPTGGEGEVWKAEEEARPGRRQSLPGQWRRNNDGKEIWEGVL